MVYDHFTHGFAYTTWVVYGNEKPILERPI